MERQVRRYMNEPFAFVVTDPGSGGAIPNNCSGMCSLVSAGAETRSLADPTAPGLQLMIEAKTVVGTITLTVPGGFNAAGNTVIPFDTVLDWVILYSMWSGSSLKWRLGPNNGVTPS